MNRRKLRNIIDGAIRVLTWLMMIAAGLIAISYIMAHTPKF